LPAASNTCATSLGRDHGEALGRERVARDARRQRGGLGALAAARQCRASPLPLEVGRGQERDDRDAREHLRVDVVHLVLDGPAPRRRDRRPGSASASARVTRSPSMERVEQRAAELWLFSGWNCTANTLSTATAAANGAP
jgi:hypothetical protein